MLVLVEDSAETLVSSYIQPGDVVGIADRRGQWSARPGIPDAPGRAHPQRLLLPRRDRDG
jgi:hypothetical protein